MDKEIKKYLITGAQGFVGHYLISALLEQKNIEIIACTRSLVLQPNLISNTLHISWEELELQNKQAVANLIKKFQPDYIVHLAAVSNIQESWQQPVHCINNNTSLILNIVDAMRIFSPHSKLLAISSAEVYDTNVEAPYSETSSTFSKNPYAISRIFQEEICNFYTKIYNLNIVNVRPFSHIGPRQTNRFVIPALIEKVFSNNEIIKVGNIDVIRDFLDVRDIVKAYLLLLEYGQQGQTYNVCSGQGRKLADILQQIIELSSKKIRIETDPALLRPNENMTIIGNPTKLQNLTQWQPQISFEQTIQDMIQYYKGSVYFI